MLRSRQRHTPRRQHLTLDRVSLRRGPAVVARIETARSLSNPQTIAAPPHGLDDRGALAELPPQGAHDCVDDVAADVGVAPDVPEQRGALDDLRLALVEVVENVELEPRQIHTPAVEHELALDRVEDRL